MKLVRDPWPLPKTGLPSGSSAGRWQSVDGAWGFHRDVGGRWIVTIGFGSPVGGVGAARASLLRQFGLANVHFKTRRQAVAALDSMLAGLEPA